MTTRLIEQAGFKPTERARAALTEASPMLAKETKEAVNYRDARAENKEKDERCGTCTFVKLPDACAKVSGGIEQDSICDFWKRGIADSVDEVSTRTKVLNYIRKLKKSKKAYAEAYLAWLTSGQTGRQPQGQDFKLSSTDTRAVGLRFTELGFGESVDEALRYGLKVVVTDTTGKGIVYKTPDGSVRVERFDPAYAKRYPVKGEPNFTIFREGLSKGKGTIGVARTLKAAAKIALKAAKKTTKESLDEVKIKHPLRTPEKYTGPKYKRGDMVQIVRRYGFVKGKGKKPVAVDPPVKGKVKQVETSVMYAKGPPDLTLEINPDDYERAAPGVVKTKYHRIRVSADEVMPLKGAKESIEVHLDAKGNLVSAVNASDSLIEKVRDLQRQLDEAKAAGKAQEALLAWLKTHEGTHELSDISRDRSLRGVHFKKVLSAAKALAKKGLINYDNMSRVSLKESIDEAKAKVRVIAGTSGSALMFMPVPLTPYWWTGSKWSDKKGEVRYYDKAGAKAELGNARAAAQKLVKSLKESLSEAKFTVEDKVKLQGGAKDAALLNRQGLRFWRYYDAQKGEQTTKVSKQAVIKTARGRTYTVNTSDLVIAEDYVEVFGGGFSQQELNEIAGAKIAQTIMDQIGRRALFMLGAKKFVSTSKGVHFRVGRNKLNVNLVEVNYNVGTDTYSIDFKQVRGLKVTTKATAEDVYADSLAYSIGQKLGLAIKMPKIVTRAEAVDEVNPGESVDALNKKAREKGMVWNEQTARFELKSGDYTVCFFADRTIAAAYVYPPVKMYKRWKITIRTNAEKLWNKRIRAYIDSLIIAARRGDVTA